jgi:hypothetical protein
MAQQPQQNNRHSITRRQFLVLTALVSAACGGLGAVGGLGGLLAIRRRLETNLQATGISSTQTAASTNTPAVTMPPILPREAWNARPVNHLARNENGYASADNPYGWLEYEGDLAQIYKTVAIHHSYPILRDTGTMRDIQDLHLDQDNWADIAYHFGIDGKGNIYTGRDIHARGASVAGFNTGTIGVVLFGDFQIETPSPAQLVAVQSLVNWLKATYSITHLAGHYEFNPITVCPGPNLKSHLDEIATRAGLLRGTGGYNGPTPVTPSALMLDCCSPRTI